jgi:hypothetical protein
MPRGDCMSTTHDSALYDYGIEIHLNLLLSALAIAALVTDRPVRRGMTVIDQN